MSGTTQAPVNPVPRRPEAIAVASFWGHAKHPTRVEITQGLFVLNPYRVQGATEVEDLCRLLERRLAAMEEQP